MNISAIRFQISILHVNNESTLVYKEHPSEQWNACFLKIFQNKNPIYSLNSYFPHFFIVCIFESLTLARVDIKQAWRRSPCNAVAYKLDCNIVVSEFELIALLWSLSDLYLWERYEPPYLFSYRLNSTTTVLLIGWVWH